MKRLILGVGAEWWVASIAGGISMLATYTNTPGRATVSIDQGGNDKARQVTSVFGCPLIEPSMSTGAVAQ